MVRLTCRDGLIKIFYRYRKVCSILRCALNDISYRNGDIVKKKNIIRITQSTPVIIWEYSEILCFHR